MYIESGIHYRNVEILIFHVCPYGFPLANSVFQEIMFAYHSDCFVRRRVEKSKAHFIVVNGNAVSIGDIFLNPRFQLFPREKDGFERVQSHDAYFASLSIKVGRYCMFEILQAYLAG
ncbi:MAG TPA: hypothetical protein DIW67_13945 [Pseudomonas sp.]|nr:hypothetical protein [Pseudomonas sp.]